MEGVDGYPERLQNGQIVEGARTIVDDCQGVETPWPLALTRKATRQRTKHQKFTGDGGALRECKAG